MTCTDFPKRALPPADEPLAGRAPAARRQATRKAIWWRQVRAWHWISAAVSLIGMLLFAVTGITLNHAADIASSPRKIDREATLPPALAQMWKGAPQEGNAPLPLSWREWIAGELGVDIGEKPGEWSADEVYVALPRAGGDAWLSIDKASGEVQYERTDRGWVSYFNDLHKGRNTGPAWCWFIDIFAAACVVFCLSGLLLLQLHARNRPATWPVVALDAALPLLFILFIH
jgi:hypothetical protein